MCLKEEILRICEDCGKNRFEEEVRNSVLDVLSLRCLLGSRDESALQRYEVVTIIVPLVQYEGVNFWFIYSGK